MKQCFQNALKPSREFILTSVRTMLKTILKRIKYNRFLLKIITHYTLLQKIIKKTRKIIMIMMNTTLIHQELIKSLLPLVNLLYIQMKGKSTKMCYHLQSIGNALIE